MKRSVGVGSYFSLPTDLAGELSSWPEFVAGTGYSVDLKSFETGETVRVHLDESEAQPEVIVESEDAASLFDRVLGRVVYALSQHSDHLIIDRHE